MGRGGVVAGEVATHRVFEPQNIEQGMSNIEGLSGAASSGA
jgi:hypothetical protein